MDENLQHVCISKISQWRSKFLGFDGVGRGVQISSSNLRHDPRNIIDDFRINAGPVLHAARRWSKRDDSNDGPFFGTLGCPLGGHERTTGVTATGIFAFLTTGAQLTRSQINSRGPVSLRARRRIGQRNAQFQLDVRLALGLSFSPTCDPQFLGHCRVLWQTYWFYVLRELNVLR